MSRDETVEGGNNTNGCKRKKTRAKERPKTKGCCRRGVKDREDRLLTTSLREKQDQEDCGRLETFWEREQS